MALASWQKAAVTRALEALTSGCGNPAGAGRPAVLLFSCRLAAITTVAQNDEVKRLADHILLVAEGLFLKPPDTHEGEQRRSLSAARDDLHRYLKSLDLVDETDWTWLALVSNIRKVCNCPEPSALLMAIEDTITEWLHARGGAHLTIPLAKELAEESKSGWFIAAHGKAEFVVGKVAVVKYTPNHFIKKTDGALLTFRSIEAARIFLADELKVLAPAVFNFR